MFMDEIMKIRNQKRLGIFLFNVKPNFFIKNLFRTRHLLNYILMKNEFGGIHEKNSCKKQILLSFLKISDCKAKVSWVQVIPESSFLQKFFPVGITFHFMSRINFSSIISEKYNIKNTSLRSSYNGKKINLFFFQDVEYHRKLKTERTSLQLFTISIFLI